MGTFPRGEDDDGGVVDATEATKTNTTAPEVIGITDPSLNLTLILPLGLACANAACNTVSILTEHEAPYI